MILYSNGCSFTWGGSLFKFERDMPTKEYPMPGLKTNTDIDRIRLETVYPYHLSKLLNINKVINDSVQAGSNARIVRKTLKYFHNLLLNNKDISDHLVTIQWTDLSRTEHFHQGGAWFQFSPNTAMAEDPNRIEFDAGPWKDMYYSSFDSDERQIEMFIQQVYTLGYFLESHKIPYVFFTHARNIASLYTNTRSTQLIKEKDLIKLLNRFVWYNNDCDHANMHESGIDTCNNAHPNENGHKQWAERLYNFINEKRLINGS